MLYLPIFLIDGNSSEVTQCLKDSASNFFDPNINEYNPDSLIKIVCGSIF